LVKILSKVNLRSIIFPRLDLTWKSVYDRLFLLLFVVDLVLRTIWLDKPSESLIFDEWYDVNVARVILHLPQSIGADGRPPYVDATPGLDPNHEHPPLAKLFIAFSMYLFGDNGFGWRIPSVIFGAIAILVFYLLMKKITAYRSLPLIATFLFSFDNLIFVQSRIAILDIFTLTFMLVGFYWYFSGHTYLSAVGMALSTLTKATGGAGFIVIIALHTARFIRDNSGKSKWNDLFSWFEKYLVVYVASFLLMLAVLDVWWVGFSNPLDHIRFILDYSSRLVSSCPNGIISCPWQWLINQIQIPYLTVNVDVTSGNVTKSFQSIAFVGAMNPAILYLTIPAMLYLAYDCYRKKGDFSLFILIWFAVTYLPYYPAVLIAQRVTYLFYFLMTMPAVCAGVAYMISDQNPPKLVVLFYLAVVALSFYWMFPFKVIPS
jgi:dolichyl-phosphate-mannose-protein mannosyltransferase